LYDILSFIPVTSKSGLLNPQLAGRMLIVARVCVARGDPFSGNAEIQSGNNYEYLGDVYLWRHILPYYFILQKCAKIGDTLTKFYIHVTVHRDKFPYNKTN
jgi:hypothetical protein